MKNRRRQSYLPLLALRLWLLLLLLVSGSPARADDDRIEEDYLRDAHVDLVNGNFDRAIQVYHDLLKKFPRSTAAWRGIGAVYFQQFKWADAAQNYLNAVAIDDQDEAAYYELGRIYFNWRKPKEGIAAFTKYLEVNPTSGYADQVRNWINTLQSVGENVDWNI